MTDIKASVIVEFIKMLMTIKNEVLEHLIYNYETNEEISDEEFIGIVYEIYEKRLKEDVRGD